MLRELDGVRRVVRQPDESCEEPQTVFVADVEPSAADELVEAIEEMGIAIDDYVLTRVDVVAPQRLHLTGHRAIDGLAWVEVMGAARANSWPLARYIALINVAAVIAALGVIVSSSILIVGAMAVSPDLLPICATCVGIVAGRRKLALRAFATLTLGLVLVVATAAILSAAAQMDRLPARRLPGRAVEPPHPRPPRLLDRAGRRGGGDRGDALLRVGRRGGGRRGDLGDDDPRLGLPRRRDRRRRDRQGARRAGASSPSTSPC